jgi:formylglycine-generating enzyme required for sulfatase activity
MPKTVKLLRYRITRRNLLRIAGGLGMTAIFGHQGSGKTKVAVSQTSPTTLSEVHLERTNLISFDFETVSINDSGQIDRRISGIARYFSEIFGDGVDLKMVAIPGGVFPMGSLPEEEGNFTESERPRHQVIVSPLYLAMYPITQAQWKAIALLPKVNIDLNPDPSYFKGDRLPVEQVSWYDAVEFCARLSRHTGRTYRLPSEAEWEYACRAGTTTPFHFGPTITSQIANYYAQQHPYAVEPEGEYRQKTTPVGSFSPNAFGLYDLHGNVYEWCADLWHNNYWKAPNDARIWTEKPYRGDRYRVLRGGGWSSEARHCRSAKRNQLPPNDRRSVIGFRVVTV